MRRYKARKNKLVAILLILVLLISVGYAALTTNLTITGNATVKVQNWRVYFENVQVKTGSVTASQAPTTSGITTSTLDWTVNMSTSGEFYEFNVDIVNGGIVDAMVDTAANSIIASTLTAEEKEYFDYTITYVNGTAVEQYDRLAAGETKTLTIKLLCKQNVDSEILPEVAQNGIHLSYSAEYVQANNNAVTKYTKYAIGDSVDYTTSLNGVTLDDWSVFYVDGEKTYLILDDYLPNSAVSDTVKSTHNLENGTGSYNIKSTTNRDDLINAMTTKSNWDSLLTGTLNGNAVSETQATNVWAMGAPTLDLWVNSWNASYPSDTLYTKYENPVTGQSYDGYYIGDTVNPTTKYINLSSKAGYNNTLYYPHKDFVEGCWGHLLASPSANGANAAMYVNCSGGLVSYGHYNNDIVAFRPVICLPSSVVNQ